MSRTRVMTVRFAASVSEAPVSRPLGSFRKNAGRTPTPRSDLPLGSFCENVKPIPAVGFVSQKEISGASGEPLLGSFRKKDVQMPIGDIGFVSQNPERTCPAGRPLGSFRKKTPRPGGTPGRWVRFVKAGPRRPGAHRWVRFTRSQVGHVWLRFVKRHSTSTEGCRATARSLCL